MRAAKAREQPGKAPVDALTALQVEERQPHFRGGAKEPLSRADIEDKFMLNCRHGGWDETKAAAALASARGLYDGPIDLEALRG